MNTDRALADLKFLFAPSSSLIVISRYASQSDWLTPLGGIFTSEIAIGINERSSPLIVIIIREIFFKTPPIP